ncbi:MAG: hypothetical protein GC146_12630 [Limimaricola sp.]|uniref:hypothetical protein n=1 Tax=Limimaricola sp. TaxID=2211665 RepID=UPI001D238AC7|nr:hypothetical protein [Limimaricola sp.]MBI1418059.1 hypothetical protein [Limimaricola sp.]
MTTMNYTRSATMIAAGLAFAGTTAQAGGMAPAIEMTPAPIVQETKASSSSAAIIIPLILIALLVLASGSKTPIER